MEKENTTAGIEPEARSAAGSGKVPEAQITTATARPGGDRLPPEYERMGDSLGFLINGLARLLRIALERRLQDKGLTPTTWTLLMLMLEEPVMPQTGLIKRTFMDAATVTRALDLLESKGLVVRKRNRRDRRAQTVALTEKGREAALRTAHLGADINMVATASLPLDQRKAYIDTTRLVVRQMLRFYGEGTLLD